MPKDFSPDLVVVGFDPAWTVRGKTLTTDMYDLLKPLALHVEHIGSTAVPGMAAKPVFDLQAGVRDLQEAQHAFAPLLADRGFELTPYRQDHVPAGSDDDPARWTKRLWTRRGHREPDVNFHVRVAGSPNERLALLFRDWLRAHPAAVPAYARFKQVLAGAVPDLATYADVKDPVVDLVIAVAEPWARATGWRVADTLTPRTSAQHT
ncbi:GrpB family protein [Streptomyces malaysiensis]|uniref:GrpB family protein n=1 Tax=Streptomyces malaysiensis subsp. samsunensis TaxID=459658 RepID=A0A9X2M6A9_STRMQ|nr:GrpB family protein [Streptomyces samsunensis]MCQ8836272.1 GrpB family protein [Streptomyces samsunensis]